jgi:1-aminocyclopropane-1-carboxylate synthase
MSSHAPSLSKRGHHLIEMPAFISAVIKCTTNPYNEQTNPNGYINLGVAENSLCAKEMAKKITEIRSKNPVSESTFPYGDFRGSMAFRQQIAKLFQTTIFNTQQTLNPDHFFVCNGAGSTIEQISAALCDQGEYVMIPAPMYHGLENDINRRMNNLMLPVQLKEVQLSEYEYVFRLDMDAIEAAYQKVNGKVRMFIHLNPHNPSGLIFTEEETRTIMKWCLERKIHFISDEVYALSLFPQAQVEFVSAMRICKENEAQFANYRDYVHVVWSFSKDFGLNGFRLGVLYTENKDLGLAMNICAYFTGISTDTDTLVTALLQDETWVNDYIALNQKRMKEAYDEIEQLVLERKIPLVRAQGSMFIFVNLLKNQDKYPKTVEGEKQLWDDMLSEKCAVYLTPGFVFSSEKPGWFRCCVTASNMKTLHLAWKRVFALFDK